MNSRSRTSLISARTQTTLCSRTSASSLRSEASKLESWHLWHFNPALIEEGKNPFSLDSKELNWERSALPLCLSKELPRLDYRLRPSRLGIAQASLTLLSLLRPFLLGEVRYLSVKKAYPNEAEELFAEAQKMAQLRYKTYIRKSQENWED